METVRTTIRRFASRFVRSYGHPDSPQSIPGNHYSKTQKRAISNQPANPNGGRKASVYIPAMIRARKGPMTALRPLMANQPMQPVTLEPTRTTIIHRPALPVLPRIDKAAVHRLARTREQERTGGDAEVAHGGLWDVRLEPGGAPDVGLHELSSVVG